jgi:hypothetical protein
MAHNMNTKTRIKVTGPLPINFRAFCIAHKTPVLCERRDPIGTGDETFYCPECKIVVDVDWWTLVAYPKSEKEKEKEKKNENEEHRKLPPQWLDIKL